MRYSERNSIRKNRPNAVLFLLCLIVILQCAFQQGCIASFRAEEAGAPSRWRYQTVENDSIVVFYDSERSKSVVRALLSASPGIISKLEKDLQIRVSKKVEVVLFSESNYRKIPRFKYEPEWAAGEAFPGENSMIIIIERLGTYPDLDAVSVFTHELSHILLHSALQESGIIIPRWFNEGVAMLEARKWGLRDRFELGSSLITGRYIPLESLRESFPDDRYGASQAYVQSFSFLSFLAERYGERSIYDLISEMKKRKDFDDAFLSVFGEDMKGIEAQWIAKITMWYRWLPVITSSITLWIAITLLFLIGYVRKKSRNAEIMKRWEEEEDHWSHGT